MLEVQARRTAQWSKADWFADPRPARRRSARTVPRLARTRSTNSTSELEAAREPPTKRRSRETRRDQTRTREDPDKPATLGRRPSARHFEVTGAKARQLSRSELNFTDNTRIEGPVGRGAIKIEVSGYDLRQVKGLRQEPRCGGQLDHLEISRRGHAPGVHPSDAGRRL